MSLDLRVLAESFDRSIKHMEDVIVALILQNRIQARVDSDKKVCTECFSDFSVAIFVTASNIMTRIIHFSWKSCVCVLMPDAPPQQHQRAHHGVPPRGGRRHHVQHGLAGE